MHKIIFTARAIAARAAVAHDHACMSQAYGIEADEHYQCGSSTGTQIMRYVSGFAESWRQSAVDPVRARQRKQIAEHVGTHTR
jgi:hypothetical protein